MNDSAARIAGLSPAKRELLARKLKEKRGETNQSQRIRRHARAEAAPLSFAQERLWFIAQFDDEAATHNMTSALRLEGPLKVLVFEQALGEITRRHEGLRTNFKLIEGGPMQFVSAHADFRPRLIDLSGLTAAVQAAQIPRLTAGETRRKFNLATDPLLRTCLLHLSPHEHMVTQTAHHIVCDGWSSRVLMRELSTLYDAFAAGRPSPLAELSLQYADFAQWQRQWLSGEVFSEHHSYWRGQLTGAPPVLELPTARPRPAVRSTRGQSVRLELPEWLTNALRELSRKNGTTLFMTMLAAWQALLSRYSGQTDISVGIPTGGRLRLETEELIGLFGNTLVLRGDLAGDPSFAELLGRTREVVLGALAHQQMPFERLVSEMQPERSLSHTPLFQVMFDLQKVGEAITEMGNVKLKDLEIKSEVSEFDLSLAILEEDEQLTGVLSYSVELYDEAMARRMVGHYQRLLESITYEPERRIGELSLLSKQEERQLLVEWNQTQADYPREKCVHELFEEQVERTPDAVAVVYEDEQLTYGELNRRANQLGHHLRSLGVGPESLAGLLMERSLEMVVGLLGILKAGGAFVPFDPEYPQERLSFMHGDSEVSVLITQRRLLASIDKPVGEVVCLDGQWDAIGQQTGENPQRRASADNLAYCIYTSGSTGRPKGVLNRHGGVVNRLLWMQDAYQLTAADVVLQKTPFSFDVSVWEFFWTLMTGARLVMSRPGGHRDSRYLTRLIKKTQVTTLHFVPSMLRQFSDAEGVDECQSVRQVMSSGEALTKDLQERFFARLSFAQLHNLYGPTEAAIDVTFWECERVSKRQSVPIGRPIWNTEIYVLDSRMDLVPVGVSGELCIGGAGVARGYHRRAELMAEKFVPHPFSASPGARLYRTGDLVRYLPDGNIEYIGRIDHQVKLRGYRIELGEVEDTLRKHPAVRESVVLVRDHHARDKCLVAYIVPASDQELCLDDLRRHLRTKLPEYMIPSAFVTLDALPLTANNKIDLAALPAPDESQRSLEQSYVGPQTQMERMVAEIWEAVLGVERVGIHDNFFDMGGHSLLMVQVQSRLRERLQREVWMLDLFRYPTISEMAKYLRQEDPAVTDRAAVHDEREDRVRAGKERMRLQLTQRRQVKTKTATARA